MRFLHCSDVHVTQQYFNVLPHRLGWRRSLALFELSVGGRARRYAAAEATLAQIQDDLSRHQIDHLLVTGDLTQYATEEEFRRARTALEPTCLDPQRCSIIPGNHDVYTPNAWAKQRFQTYFGHLLQSDFPEHARARGFPYVRVLGDEVAVVGLNSAKVPPVPGLAFGRLGHEQLDALRDIVHDERLAHRSLLVLVHHAPLGPNGRPDRRAHGLVDARALLNLLRGERFAVLHGHIHHRYYHAATSDRPHLFCAGSSTQARHEGYWVLEVRDGRIQPGEMRRPGA